MMEFVPEKVLSDVQYEGLDQHGSEIFEMQLPIKFHPNPITKSKVMPSGNPYIILFWLKIT